LTLTSDVTRTDHASMTVQHAIVAFPVFDAPEPIEAVRREFDPQASLLSAHITLVFPFVASLDPAALCDHMTATISEAERFDVTLAAPTAEQDAYVFLRVESGRRRIIGLHDRLYAGPLRAHLSQAHAYEPHITLGRLSSPEALTAAVTLARRTLAMPLHARIDSVALFRIENGRGRVELTMPLAGSGSGRSISTRAAPGEC
jgi:2'-5' RNA ligase